MSIPGLVFDMLWLHQVAQSLHRPSRRSGIWCNHSMPIAGPGMLIDTLGRLVKIVPVAARARQPDRNPLRRMFDTNTWTGQLRAAIAIAAR